MFNRHPRQGQAIEATIGRGEQRDVSRQPLGATPPRNTGFDYRSTKAQSRSDPRKLKPALEVTGSSNWSGGAIRLGNLPL
jgi:hypothetical protein